MLFATTIMAVNESAGAGSQPSGETEAGSAGGIPASCADKNQLAGTHPSAH